MTAPNTLTFNSRTNSYVFRTTYADREIPRSAGFRWSSETQTWTTQSARIATSLIEYCADPTLVARIETAVSAETAAIEAAKRAALDKLNARIDASRAQNADVDLPSPEGLTYLPFQKAGIAYALGRKDALVADEMGLGKTIQALGVANSLMASSVTGTKLRVLVVAPKIALPNWRNEADKWLMHGHTVGIGNTKAWPDTNVVIVNYDLIGKADIKRKLDARVWDLVIFDEAHALKSPGAARTKAAIGGGKGPARVEAIPARRRLFLTGSPILNRPVELFPLLNAMRCDYASNFFRFAERYCEGRQEGYGYNAKGASNLAELETKLRSSVMVRRRKAEVLSDLPEKRHDVVLLAADDPAHRKALAEEGRVIAAAKLARREVVSAVAEAKAKGDGEAYKAAVARLNAGRMVEFAEIARVRRETAVSKVPQMVEHITAMSESVPDALLVFAHHKEVISGLVDGLKEAGISAAVITGDTSDAARQAAQDDIQAGSKRVFIGSMRACGVAITLTAASTVVFAEQDWTPGIMRQAEDRAHRIGQRNSVLVQSVVLDGSFDARMAKMVAAKGGVVDAALDGLDMAADEVAKAVKKTRINKDPSR